MKKNKKTNLLIIEKRKKINLITKKIVHLLLKRQKISHQIIFYKKSIGQSKTDKTREAKILQICTNHLKPIEKKYIHSILKQILKSTKNIN